MKRIHFSAIVIALLGGLIGGAMLISFSLLQAKRDEPASGERDNVKNIQLPAPKYEGKISLEEALLKRRSVREYRDEPLTLTEVAQILWAAQGITDRISGFRTAPSAGALYPLEVYAVVGNVRGVAPGVYKYLPQQHQLKGIRKGDVRAELSASAVEQTWIGQAGIVVVICAVYDRTTGKYGERGIRYVHMEVGHAAQNLCLQAVSLNLGAGLVGAFHDKQVKKILNAQEKEQPLYIVPVGVK